jgi:hypothetical protein
MTPTQLAIYLQRRNKEQKGQTVNQGMLYVNDSGQVLVDSNGKAYMVVT